MAKANVLKPIVLLTRFVSHTKRALSIATIIVLLIPVLPVTAAPSQPGNVNLTGDNSQPTINWDPSLAAPTGVNWTEERGQSPAGVDWSARAGHTSAVFNNKLWVI